MGVKEAGARAVWARVPKEGPVDRYLEEMETLSGAVGELVEAGREFVAIGEADPENMEGMTACVEQMREVKEKLVAFSEEVQPPRGLEAAHGKMAEAVANYAELIDVYCDVLLANLSGEEHPEQESLQSEWEELGASVADAMEEMRRAVASLPAG